MLGRWSLVLLCLCTHTVCATNYTTQQTANGGQTLTFNPGDTITIPSTTANVFALAALGNGATINASGVTINTADSGGFGVNATSGGIVNLTNGTSITTTGSGASAINTSAATVNASNISILTIGDGSFGVKATNSPITISSSTIQTNGATSFAITSNGLTARLRGSGLQVIALGDNSAGLNAVTNSQFSLDSSSVLTTGLNSNGAQVASSATMTLTNDSITTQGNNAFGLSVMNTNTQLSGSNLIVSTTGIGSHGAAVQSGGNLNLTNTTINTANSGASALAILNSGGSTSTVTINGGSLVTQQADAIISQSGMANITLQNGTTINGGSGNLLNASSSSNINFTASNNVTLTGNIISDSSSTVNMSLLNNSVWNGAATNLASLTIDPSVWNITASSNITGTLTNAGIINFTPPSSGGFKTLTVGNYNGQNGIINLNTTLGTDNSPSDSLVINGGTATGTTTLNITNIGGLGDVTQANGILVVNTINGGSVSPHAFVLGNLVMAGPFEYTLFQGNVDASNPNNFFLRSVAFDPSAPASAFLPGQPFFVPNYRPEVSLYTALPTMEMLYNRMLLDTFHQRVGTEEQLFHSTNHVNAWLRVVNQGGNINNDTIFAAGPNFNYHFEALQAGTDLLHKEHLDGSRDYAGIYGVIGTGNGDVEHFDGTNAGNDRFNAATAGGYWTHIGPKNWYLDGIIQGTWLNANARNAVDNIKPRNNDFGASLEGGYPFFVYNSVVLEPQAQVVFQTLNGGANADSVSALQFERTNSFAGRLGLEVANTWQRNSNQTDSRTLTAFARVSEWHETEGNSHTRFFVQSGYIPFTSKLPADWAQADLGITGRASKNISIYGTLSRAIFFDNRGKSYNAILGFRFNLC